MNYRLLLTVLAVATFWLAAPDAGAAYRGGYRYSYGGGGGYGRYNSWNGGAYRGRSAGYNNYTGRYGGSRSYYNPYTGRSGSAQGFYNPYTNRYAYHYNYGY